MALQVPICRATLLTVTNSTISELRDFYSPSSILESIPLTLSCHCDTPRDLLVPPGTVCAKAFILYPGRSYPLSDSHCLLLVLCVCNFETLPEPSITMTSPLRKQRTSSDVDPFSAAHIYYAEPHYQPKNHTRTRTYSSVS